jgi:hypothetical protein
MELNNGQKSQRNSGKGRGHARPEQPKRKLTERNPPKPNDQQTEENSLADPLPEEEQQATEEDDIDDDNIENSAFGQCALKKKQESENPKTNTKKVILNPTDLQTKVDAKNYRFAILFSKVCSITTADVYKSDIETIIASIFNKDREALILPHNNSPVQAISQLNFASMKGMDYAKFFDIQIIPWGSPNDNKRKAAFSFYIASDYITANLKSLRDDDNMKKALTSQNISMAPHKLHESLDVSIGFLLGETQKHTYREELEKRIRVHLQHSQLKKQLKEQGKQNIYPQTANYHHLFR